jgi:NAD+ kinase
MQKFMLITNEHKDDELTFSKQIVSYIRARGGSAGICVSGNEGGEGRDFDLSEIPADTECILVLGGDGTLIRAATRVESLHIPLIGVNLGTLGYLCELEESTVFSGIDSLFADEYIVEDRVVLMGQKAGEEEFYPALNDVIIHWEGKLSMVQLSVKVNGEFLATYRADGVIVATPTGSTGYSMSAGGPIVDPKAHILLMTPINAHDLNSQSIVLGAEAVVEIEMGSRRYQKDESAGVSFDGDTKFHLSAGESVRIEQSPEVIKICRISNQSFLETLRKKMKN